jgi:hypothetical protein
MYIQSLSEGSGVMPPPSPSLTIFNGADYLNFAPFLGMMDFDHALSASQFDSAKHLRHSREWKNSNAGSPLIGM